MSFLWPQLLWWLPLLAALPLAYVRLMRRRNRQALRLSSLGVVREAVAGRQWRRHVPAVLMFLGFAGLLLAAARPVARVPLPWAHSSVLLAMDVSLSMRVSDVQPTRMEAAQAAAKLFLRELPKNIEVGLVTFAGSSQVVQRATLDRAVVAAGIDAFQMQFGTAVGDAIVVCLSELFPDEGIDLGELTFGGGSKGQRPGQSPGRSLDDKPKRPQKDVQPVTPGSYDSAAIILLSDGRRTTGIDTLVAARMAADHGVRVYVIGLGTVDGDVSAPDGMAIYMKLDEPTLREVARMTGGEYHHAGTADTLRSVYEKLGSRVQVQTRETELTGLLALCSALLMLGAATLSVLWFGRVA